MISRRLVPPKGNLLFFFLPLIFLSAFFLTVQQARAAQVTLAWDPDPSTAAETEGYKLYYGTSSGVYGHTQDAGNTTYYTFTNLQDGVAYYFAATAYNSSTESDLSNEVTFSPQPITHTVTASGGQGGFISPSGTVTVPDGGSQTFNITTNSGYTIAALVVDGVSQAPAGTYTFSNVTANHTLQVSFAAVTYTLTVNKGGTGSGTVTTTPGGSSFPSGTAVTLTAVAASGSTFTGWSGACAGTSSTCAVAMTSNLTVTASFGVSTWTITASSGSGGSISPAGTTTVPTGANKTYVISPYHGYVISAVKVDGVSVGKPTSYTFRSVAANHTIQATFSPSNGHGGR